MVFPHPFLMARIGQSLSDLQHEEVVRKCEQYASEWEDYGRELQRKFDNISVQYEQLRSAYDDLASYSSGIEQERNALLDEKAILAQQTDQLGAMIKKVTTDSERLQRKFDDFVQQNLAKLEGYARLKNLLSGMVDNADTVFTNEVTPEMRKRISDFVNNLP